MMLVFQGFRTDNYDLLDIAELGTFLLLALSVLTGGISCALWVSTSMFLLASVIKNMLIDRPLPFPLGEEWLFSIMFLTAQAAYIVAMAILVVVDVARLLNL